MMAKSMKPSGIEWMEDIPAEWNVKRLGFLFTFGKGLSITKEDLQDEGIPCVNYGEIHSKYGFEVNPAVNHLRCVSEKYLRTDKKSLLKYGDFLFADTSEDLEGSGNFTYLNSNDKAFAGYHTIILRLREEIDRRYVAYLFDSIFFRTQIRNKVWGIKVYSITQPVLKNAKIILPPPKEQQAIAAFLDAQCAKIDGIIAEMEQQIAILKQYKTSLITEAVTKGLNKDAPMKDSGIEWIGKIPAHWEVKRLKYIGSAKNGLTYAPENICDEGILVLRSSNIQGGRLAFEDNVYVNMKIPDEIIVRENDILVCSRNGSRELIGKCALIDKRTAGNTYGAFMCVYRSPNNRFIHYVFQSELFNYYLGNYLTSTINQLTNTNLYNMKIPLTFDVKEQFEIVAYLDKKCKTTDDIITEKRQSIDTMRAYKRSLIYEYVTGKKRVAGNT
jgi:type I restriction enzyme S subunit